MSSQTTARRVHLIGWLCCAFIIFLQSPGKTVADTKHDLVANPARFLGGALHAWTDTFPLGQLQNQAYGYLFPQGLFFLLTDPLPDWIAQRLWWLIVVGVGFSGFFTLLNRLGRSKEWSSTAFMVLAAMLYAFSPRTISTLGAISSETWTVMLAPWVIVPFVHPIARIGPAFRAVAASVLAVAAMGAVNATATLAACVPAGLYLLSTLRQRPWYTLPAWVTGCALVSAWWVGPLLVLGRYAPPFTDFIENAWVTTRWLNPTEILRGTTSWTPFVDTERTAGFQLATEPTFILITGAVAALGVAGLARRRTPQRGVWVIMLCTGVLILGAAHGPFGDEVRAFLDGPGAALRNVHKFDPVVRIPLLVGLATWGSVVRLPQTWAETARSGRRQAAGVLVVSVLVCAVAPAWSGRLAPKGAYGQVPGYWQEAADWLNNNAADTRTLIVPGAQFARQSWGWTRDEPLQPLLSVPWVVRDAIPLVEPEAIRGLDGLMATLASDAVDPKAAFESAAQFGVGVVAIRHDLTSGDAKRLSSRAREAGFPIHTFGEVDIVEVDRHAGMRTSPDRPTRVAGGGESVAMLAALTQQHPAEATYQLTNADAEVVTDTPQLTARNYGAVSAAASAALADLDEGSDVHNPVKDYPSVGPLTSVAQHGGRVTVSSSAADATSFGGVQSRRSASAAVDGDLTTSWYPTPGTQEGQWIDIDADSADADSTEADGAKEIEVRTTGGSVAATFTANGKSWSEWLQPHRTMRFTIPEGPATQVRLTLGESRHPVGITEFRLVGAPVTREITVPNTSPNARQFFFQQLTSRTDLLARTFTAPRPMDVRIDAPTCRASPATPMRIILDGDAVECGETVHLDEGEHTIRTHAQWLLLTEPGFTGVTSTALGNASAAADQNRLVNTMRAHNPGLEGYAGETRLEGTVLGADMQAFTLPAGVSGDVHLRFSGDTPYRISLLVGCILWAITCLGCLIVVARTRAGGRRLATAEVAECSPGIGRCALVGAVAGGLLSMWIAGSWSGLAAGALGLALGIGLSRVTGQADGRSVTAFTGGSMGIAALWLAHAPWPNAHYAGDQPFVSGACFLALGFLLSTFYSTLGFRAAGKQTPGS